MRSIGTRDGLVSALSIDPSIPFARLLLANCFDGELFAEAGPPSIAPSIRAAWLRDYELRRLPGSNALTWLKAAEILIQAPEARVGISSNATTALFEAKVALRKGLEYAMEARFDPLKDAAESLHVADIALRLAREILDTGQEAELGLLALSLAERIITDLVNVSRGDPRFIELWQGTYRSLTGYHILNGDFNAALAAAETGSRVGPVDLRLERARALALLFVGRTAEAEVILRMHVGKTMEQGSQTWEASLLDTFEAFEQIGRPHPEFSRLREFFEGRGR